ncbi:nucleotide-diphospho-sugar transferase [Armillaria gallica]|uniref:Nucleotide-diphospho-sugar transferase n=1 Tax=Armillaria gallica TaxID=47427 RepID=A0A2H3EM16_ARMGA|nr:nucleotide-diphospho-sugar transferase [Armillaria gallica]
MLNYPYVLLNKVDFNDDFKKLIDEDKVTEACKKMVSQSIIYSGMRKSYRNMCCFNSGFFFRHDLVKKYHWYWRIEPNVHFHCNINFNPFVYMEDYKKIYIFTIAIDTTYNLCHYVATYTVFSDYLKSQGGFYYEQWDDMPVHSIAATLFVSKDQIQFFDEIGYKHFPYTHCPRDEEMWR